jgi:hypothetical protein
MRIWPLLALLSFTPCVGGCDARALAKPNPRVNAWHHVVNALKPNEAEVDVTNDGGPGWVTVGVSQDGRPVGSTRAYFTAGQQQVVRFPLSSTLWKLQVTTFLTCEAAADEPRRQ